MEIKKLYVVELVNGEKHYFATECDSNYYLNRLSGYLQATAKQYEIVLGM